MFRNLIGPTPRLFVAFALLMLAWYWWPHSLRQSYVPQEEQASLTILRETSFAGRSVASSDHFLSLKRKASRVTVSQPGVTKVSGSAKKGLVERAVGFADKQMYVAAELTADADSTSDCNRYRLFISEGGMWKQTAVSAGEHARWYRLKDGGESPRPFPFAAADGAPIALQAGNFDVNESLISCKRK